MYLITNQIGSDGKSCHRLQSAGLREESSKLAKRFLLAMVKICSRQMDRLGHHSDRTSSDRAIAAETPLDEAESCSAASYGRMSGASFWMPTVRFTGKMVMERMQGKGREGQLRNREVQRRIQPQKRARSIRIRQKKARNGLLSQTSGLLSISWS